jgi:hypothetical protein
LLLTSLVSLVDFSSSGFLFIFKKNHTKRGQPFHHVRELLVTRAAVHFFSPPRPGGKREHKGTKSKGMTLPLAVGFVSLVDFSSRFLFPLVSHALAPGGEE